MLSNLSLDDTQWGSSVPVSSQDLLSSFRTNTTVTTRYLRKGAQWKSQFDYLWPLQVLHLFFWLKQGKESWCTLIDFGVLDVIMKQSSQTVGPCNLMLGRVPLFHLFLKGNATPTLPHKLRHLKGSKFQYGTADVAAADGSWGSNVYKANQWLWQFGHRGPRLESWSMKPRELEGATRSTGHWGSKRSHKIHRRREAAMRGDEWNIWHEYLWSDIPG